MKRRTIRKIRFWGITLVLVITAFFLGRIVSPAKADTVTVYKYKSAPEYKADKLPKTVSSYYFDVPLSHSLQDFIYENDYGLLQINKVNHEWLKKKYRTADMLNPYQNVFCGIKIIGTYVKKYKGDINKALMAYNMGDYGAKKAWQNGITSTRYSLKIMELKDKYEVMLNDK